MTIPYAPGFDAYTLFYLLATLTNVLLLLWEGHRRGFPLRPWLALVGASSLALILGSKLITHPLANWGTVLLSNEPADTARSILGGSAAATLTVLALRRWLGLSWAVLDALALPLCAALAVQCIGCVLTGCCFGLPTTGAWGLSYAAGTLPWLAQVATGLLPSTAAQSLPVAPTQLLALALCVAVGVVLLATRQRRWPVGSWLLLQTGLLLLGRVAQGFWRDPLGEPVAGHVHAALGTQWLELQIVLLPLGLLAVGVWAWRVRRYQLAASPAPVLPVPAAQPWHTLAVLLAMFALTAVLGPQALTLPEVLVVRALLLTVLLAEASNCLASLRLRGPRLVGMPLALVLTGAVLLTTAQAPAPTHADSTGVTQSTIVTGGALGNYHEAENNFQSGGCGSGEQLATQQQVRAVGAEVAFEKAKPTGGSQTWGVGVWGGQQTIEARPPEVLPYPLPGARTLHYALGALHLYREGHRENGWKSMNLRVGMHLGTLGYYSYFHNDNSKNAAFFMPEVMFRMGKPSVLYGQADFCYGAENTLGAYTTRFGLGSGLGMTKGPSLLVGYANSPHQPTSNLGFVSAVLRMPGGKGLSLEPYYATDFSRHNSFSLKMNYRFNR